MCGCKSRNKGDCVSWYDGDEIPGCVSWYDGDEIPGEVDGRFECSSCGKFVNFINEKTCGTKTVRKHATAEIEESKRKKHKLKEAETATASGIERKWHRKRKLMREVEQPEDGPDRLSRGQEYEESEDSEESDEEGKENSEDCDEDSENSEESDEDSENSEESDEEDSGCFSPDLDSEESDEEDLGYFSSDLRDDLEVLNWLDWHNKMGLL